jgi:hypothetical protein
VCAWERTPRSFAPRRRADAGERSPRLGATLETAADVAQLVEHFTRNEGVPGSSPGVGSLGFQAFLTSPSGSSRQVVGRRVYQGAACGLRRAVDRLGATVCDTAYADDRVPGEPTPFHRAMEDALEQSERAELVESVALEPITSEAS